MSESATPANVEEANQGNNVNCSNNATERTPIKPLLKNSNQNSIDGLQKKRISLHRQRSQVSFDRDDSATNSSACLSNSEVNEKDPAKYIVATDSSSLGSRSSRSWKEICACECLPTSGCCRKKRKRDDPLELPYQLQDDPFRKKCSRACLTFVYVLLAIIAVVVTYSMIADLVKSMNNPVRSIHYHKVKEYDPPGIAVYPGGAKFLACGHYYNNVVTSKVRTSDLDLVNLNCSFTRLRYDDPHYVGVERDVLIVRGPTSFEKRETVFIHFELEDATRDFFTVSYFVFPGWDRFNASELGNQITELSDLHRFVPTFALSSGLRMWIKLIMSETYLLDGTKHTDYRVEYSVVKFWDRRPEHLRGKHLFFIFFEWKNNIIEQSYLIHTTTPWSIGAGLCGVFLTLHRFFQLAQTSYQRVQKDKQRRSIRKRTLRELRQKSVDHNSKAIQKHL